MDQHSTMTLQLDHAVIAVDDLDAAVQNYRALGFTVVRGGVHANRATHNALITFADETYLELLAATGEPPIPGAIDFGALLSGGEGLAGYALRADDLDAELARLRAVGLAADWRPYLDDAALALLGTDKKRAGATISFVAAPAPGRTQVVPLAVDELKRLLSAADGERSEGAGGSRRAAPDAGPCQGRRR